MISDEQRAQLRDAAKAGSHTVFERIGEELFVTRQASEGESVQGVLVDAAGRTVSLETREVVSFDEALKLLK